MNLEEVIAKLLNKTDVIKVEVIQKLWSNYGELSRYYCEKDHKTFIVKSIQPPLIENHPRGWNSITSLQRKLKSYEVETAFYQKYSSECDVNCYVPQLIHSSTSKNAISNQKERLLIMEDLKSGGYPIIKTQLSVDEIKVVIKWLAYFHAKYINVEPEGLWPIGSYWHLATRKDEYTKMEESKLKEVAYEIEKTINTAKYQTLIHGDAKLANFCFNENGQKVAGVDFQYVGKGIGVKDLQYFLGSCLSSEELFEFHDELLDEYFYQLKNGFFHYKKNVDAKAVISEWRELYTFSCADFQRFLAGWSPSHQKINRYFLEQTHTCLEIIVGKSES